MNMNLSQLETYIEKLIALRMGDVPYTIDWESNMVHTPAGDWSVRIPERILRDITLEEI